MRNALRALAFFAMLLPGVAAAQCNSSTPLPVNTVLGRLGITPGPCQAIPLSILGAQLQSTNKFVNGPASTTIGDFALWSNTVGTGLSDGGTPGPGVLTFLITPSSANLRAALTDETGTGAAVFGTAPTISSLTLTGTLTASAANFSGAVAITSNSGQAFAVGPNGATNPTFSVDGSAGSAVAGIKIGGAATGGTANIIVTDSGSSASLGINAKGTGTIGIGSVSTGAVTIAPPLTLSAALTYGGVTLSNAVTGTGSMVLGTSPSIASLTVTSAFTATGLVTNADLANPATTVNGQTCTLGSTCTITAVASSITVGTTTVTGGPGILYNSAGGGTLTAGALAASAVFVTNGSSVPSFSTTLPSGIAATNMALTTPALGVATGTSLALGGASLSGNALAATGSAAISGALTSGAHIITSASASAFAVGPNGTTNPAFNVDASTASQVAGLNIRAAISGGTVSILTTDSGTNAGLSVNSKGNGTLALNNSGAGGVLIGGGGGGATVFNSFTATGLVTYADMASAALATAAQYMAGTASTLVSSNIAFTSETTTTYSTTTTFDFSTFINTAVTLTGNITTQTLSNVKAGQAGTITFIQDGSGSHTSVWNSIFKFAGGATPTLSTAANAIDVLSYSCRSTSFCVAALIKDDR